MEDIKKDCSDVAVYCASSPDIDPIYFETAQALGFAMARAGLGVVCGGGRSGLMKAVIDGELEAGGRAIGVIPAFMVERQWNHPRLTEMIVTETMHERKQRMAQLSRGAIILPGGCGTLDETFDIITLRQLGLYQGHIVILNIGGYYDPLRQMLDRMIDLHFMNPDHRDLWHFTDSVDQAVEIMLRPVPHRPFTQKLPVKP